MYSQQDHIWWTRQGQEGFLTCEKYTLCDIYTCQRQFLMIKEKQRVGVEVIQKMATHVAWDK